MVAELLCMMAPDVDETETAGASTMSSLTVDVPVDRNGAL